MALALMSAVWADPRTAGADRLVLLALAWYARDDGQAWPAVATLARVCRLSTRQVQRTLRRLEAAGLITPVARAAGGRSLTAVYRLSLTAAAPKRVTSGAQKGDARAQKGDARAQKGDARAQKGDAAVSPDPLTSSPLPWVNDPSPDWEAAAAYYASLYDHTEESPA